MSNYQHFNQTKRKQLGGKNVAVVRYDSDNDAPRVVAQGKGQIANQIIEMAKQHDIEMQEEPNLLANLLDIDLGEQIPPQLYSVMAEILLLIEKMEKNY